jgi:hypothetical protein
MLEAVLRALGEEMRRFSNEQIAFGQRLGLDLEGKSVSEALALIHDTIDRDFLGLSDLGAATPKQLELPSFSATSLT